MKHSLKMPGLSVFFVCLLLHFPTLFCALPLIEKITTKGNNVPGNMLIVEPNAEFKRNYLTGDFYVKYGEGIDFSTMDESVRLTPFIGSVIHIVWASGNIYTIDTMDEDLFYTLQKVKEVLQIFYPDTDWSGELIPQKLINNKKKYIFDSRKVGVLFSGGLDAVGTSFSHLDKEQLLITIRGRDVKLSQDTMWANVKKQCISFAQTYGHTNFFLVSNFHAFINHEQLKKQFPSMPYWGDTSQSLAFAGLVTPILLHYNIPTVLMASSNTIECPFAYGSHPLIDNNIQLSGIQFRYDRPDLTRIGKLECVLAQAQRYKLPKPKLRVCWGNDQQGGNCYKCEKCIRTMNLILALGEDPHDFGFNQTVEDIETITKKYFSADKKKFLKFEVAWDWECVQKKISEILADKTSSITYSPEVAEYLAWFCSIQLDRFCIDRRDVFERNKKRFAPLWAASEQGPISLATIKTLHTKFKEMS